jgi:hypothetical protein
MVEYGQGVGHATGVAGGSGGATGQTTDVGASAAAFIGDAVHQVQALPPEGLLLLVVAIFFGLILLRKAI